MWHTVVLTWWNDAYRHLVLRRRTCSRQLFDFLSCRQTGTKTKVHNQVLSIARLSCRCKRTDRRVCDCKTSTSHSQALRRDDCKHRAVKSPSQRADCHNESQCLSAMYRKLRWPWELSTQLLKCCIVTKYTAVEKVKRPLENNELLWFY